MSDRRTSPKTLAMVGGMAREMRLAGVAPDARTLATATGLSPRTVRRAIGEMREAGTWLERNVRPEGRDRELCESARVTLGAAGAVIARGERLTRASLAAEIGCTPQQAANRVNALQRDGRWPYQLVRPLPAVRPPARPLTEDEVALIALGDSLADEEGRVRMVDLIAESDMKAEDVVAMVKSLRGRRLWPYLAATPSAELTAKEPAGPDAKILEAIRRKRLGLDRPAPKPEPETPKDVCRELVAEWKRRTGRIKSKPYIAARQKPREACHHGEASLKQREREHLMSVCRPHRVFMEQEQHP